MQTLDFNIAIVGGGCIGSSILHELCQRNIQNIVLLDHGRKTLSATAGSGGMLRVFHENTEHIDLALGNHALLENYRRAGVLTEKTNANGSLYFFNQKRLNDYTTNLSKMEKSHYPFEILTANEGKKRFPQFQWKHEECAIYEALGSQITPQLFVENLLRASSQYGTQLFSQFEVRHIRSYQDQFQLFGDDLIVTAKTIVLAGGARLLPRLKDLKLNLPLEAKTLTTYLVEKPQTDFFLPNYFDRETLEFAGFGQNGTANLSKLNLERFVEKPKFRNIAKISAEDCYAPNRIGYAGYVSEHPGLILATGWGGTAFKFALEVGHRVANIIRENN